MRMLQAETLPRALMIAETLGLLLYNIAKFLYFEIPSFE